MKIGIIVDSSCGLSKKQANERGWGFLPLIMNINGKEYMDGIDMDPKDFYATIKITDEVKTSATPPAYITDEFKKFSEKDYDLIIVYGISAGLSSQTNSLKAFAKDYPKIHVVDSRGVSYLIVREIESMLKLAEQPGQTKESIGKAIDDLSKREWGLAILTTLKWAAKGGRVSPSVAGMVNLLGIVPVLRYEDGKLEKHKIGRVFKKSVLNAAVEVAEKGDIVYLVHGGNKNIKELKVAIEAEIGRKVEEHYFPPVIALHTGPEVVAVLTSMKQNTPNKKAM